MFPDGCPGPSSVSLSPLLQQVFLDLKTLRLHRASGFLLSHSLLPVALQPLPSSFLSHWSCSCWPLPISLLEVMVQAFSFTIIFISYLEKGGGAEMGQELSNCFMLTLSGYQAPNIILDIQPGGNHVIEDSQKKVCCPALSVDRSSGREVCSMFQ